MLKQLRGSLLLLTAAIIWGTAFVAQSEGMNYVEPFTYNAIRTLIGGIILIPVILMFRLGRRHSAAGPPASSRKATVSGSTTGSAAPGSLTMFSTRRLWCVRSAPTVSTTPRGCTRATTCTPTPGAGRSWPTPLI